MFNKQASQTQLDELSDIKLKRSLIVIRQTKQHEAEKF